MATARCGPWRPPCVTPKGARGIPVPSEIAVREALLPGAVRRAHLALAAQQPAVGEQPFDADGAAGVQLASADPDLGPEAVAVAVGEATRGVVVHAGGVDRAEEALRRRGVAGDDGL